MPRILTPMLLMLAHATHAELICQIQFLKAENEILRAKLPKQIRVTTTERKRLIKLGKAVGDALKELITIVSPRTFARWIAKAKKATVEPDKKPGRPRTKADIRELILRLVKENATWGYTRLLGELKKLRIKSIGRTTIRDLLKEQGIDPELGPKGKTTTWDEFIKSHKDTLWACDLLSQKVLTIKGYVEFYIIFFIQIESRKVWASPGTPNPNDAWMTQQARNFCIHLEEQGQAVTHLLRDRDGKFSAGGFDNILKATGTDVIQLPARSPNLNCFSERWVRSIRNECLDYFVVMGERHLNYLVATYVDYYHKWRPHQGKGNATLTPTADTGEGDDKPLGKICCQEFLGGVLKHYYRDAG